MTQFQDYKKQKAEEKEKQALIAKQDKNQKDLLDVLGKIEEKEIVIPDNKTLEELLRENNKLLQENTKAIQSIDIPPQRDVEIDFSGVVSLLEQIRDKEIIKVEQKEVKVEVPEKVTLDRNQFNFIKKALVSILNK